MTAKKNYREAKKNIKNITVRLTKFIAMPKITGQLQKPLRATTDKLQCDCRELLWDCEELPHNYKKLPYDYKELLCE